MTIKGVLKRLAVVGMALLLIGLAGHVTSGRATAQGGAGTPAILQAIQQLQNSVNALPKNRFYLTKDLFSGNQALTACAAPYHMASLWEILDPSNLTYDSNQGYKNDDSGSGPPANTIGWIRTGGPATGSFGGGAANCNVWTSSSSSDSGTVVELSQAWGGDPDVASPWNADAEPCNDTDRVWCVQR